MKRHILIVDDNKVDTLKIRNIIESDDVVPIVTNDPRAALEISRSHRLDLAVVDIHMPQMNGFKLTSELRAHQDTKSLPILIMSGTYKAEEDVKSALQAGANDFILKPIDPQIITSKISRILTNRVEWGEWKFSDAGITQEGTVKIKIEVESISEMGIRILSSVPLIPKSCPELGIPLMDELEIIAPFLQVVECKKTGKGYSSYLTFVGMPEAQLKKIRLYCRKLSAERKENKSA